MKKEIIIGSLVISGLMLNNRKRHLKIKEEEDALFKFINLLEDRNLNIDQKELKDIADKLRLEKRKEEVEQIKEILDRIKN